MESAFRNQRKKKNHLQFIVNEGILYNKRDMVYLLRDLGYIVYFEVVRNRVVNKGHGYIMRVCANSEEPTLFLKGRVYINVNSFNYLQVKSGSKGRTIYELHSDVRVIKIVPEDRPRFREPSAPGAFTDKLIGLGVVSEEDLPSGGSEPPEEYLSDEWFDN